MATLRPEHLRRRQLIDATGERVGRVHEVWADRDSGVPEWLTVSTGWFGTHVTFVPLDGVTDDGTVLQTPQSVGHIRRAPRVEAGDGELSLADEARLDEHYGERSAERARHDTRDPGGRATGVSSEPTPLATRPVEADPSRTGAHELDLVERSEDQRRAERTGTPGERSRLRRWTGNEAGAPVGLDHDDAT